jgi:hypothetical protein
LGEGGKLGHRRRERGIGNGNWEPKLPAQYVALNQDVSGQPYTRGSNGLVVIPSEARNRNRPERGPDV